MPLSGNDQSTAQAPEGIFCDIDPARVSVKEHGHDRAVALHRAWLTGRSIGKGLSKELLQRRKAVLEALPALRGKNLACWCPLPEHGEPDNCHAAQLAVAHV
jgi:Domain of unknown function (DUF4326)